MTEENICEKHQLPYQVHPLYKIEYCNGCYEENKAAMLKDLDNNYDAIIPKSHPLLDMIRKNQGEKK